MRLILCILEAGDDDLTAIQSHFRQLRSSRPRAFGAAALLCLALLSLLFVVQVAHVHAVDGDADHCQLCIAMHSAAPVAVMAAVVVMVSFGASAPLVESRVVVRLRHPKLFTRPPPSGR